MIFLDRHERIPRSIRVINLPKELYNSNAVVAFATYYDKFVIGSIVEGDKITLFDAWKHLADRFSYVKFLRFTDNYIFVGIA